MAESIIVKASQRTEFGKNCSRRLRRSGSIPATVYGQGKNATSLSLDPKIVNGILHSHAGQNTIFELTVDGQDTTHALIKDFQLDPINGKLLHVDLLRIDMTTKLKVKVPFEIVGQAVGVKVGGGLLDIVLREIEVECLPADIPEHIPVDVTHLALNQALRVSELQVSDRIQILTDPDAVVVHVAPIRAEAEVPAEAPAETAEPEVIKKGKAAAEGEAGEEEEKK
jgi:large subunit ribosomal protein L25